ncbi:ribbon-helix-helix protein, CopG family [Streptomyces sp. NPDC005438]|uniref:ribbon-helix-helix protein, CopG family n=1 Tax=Streptomyces sp. NPDC005438 TaxID=3156880 RepID=UPI0033A3944F
MTSSVLSLRIDSELLDRLQEHAAKRGMTVQDYVIRALHRDDFDERFRASVERVDAFYGGPCSPGDHGH